MSRGVCDRMGGGQGSGRIWVGVGREKENS